MTGTGHSRLELAQVTKSFGGVRAVDALSLDIAPGGITTLLGPSGCGKTTALRIIAGFLDADSGDVLLDGQSILGLPPFRRDTAMVFQDYALFPHMNVAQNVGYGLRQRRLNAAESRRRVGGLLEFLQLDRFSERMPHELSGGQQQRVALGRALAVRPKVLLMDEPLSNLDARLRVTVRTELRQIQRELGVTTVFVTHDQEEALSLSDRIVIMNAGRVVQAGAPRELYDLPRSRFAAYVLGDANFLQADSFREEGGEHYAALAGQQIRVRRAAPGDGSRELLMVRPDWFRLDAEPETGGLELKATLETVEFHGGFERCWFRAQGQSELLQVDVPAGGPIPGPGETARLVLPPGKAVILHE